VTAPASPWQNAYAERLIGTIRRELRDHVIVLNERHLRRLLKTYVAYYNRWRTHRSLEGDAPDTRPVRPASPHELQKFRLSKGFITTTCPRLHEFSGPTGQFLAGCIMNMPCGRRREIFSRSTRAKSCTIPRAYSAFYVMN
jgi:hypothetical protein